ncbi:MAG: CAP domain-containing protein [Bacteroidetes bacterium]|nr:CAP domain-containing protein [Bacteroidota bacterium]
MKNKFILLFLFAIVFTLADFSFIDNDAALRKQAADDYKKNIAETQFTSTDQLHWTGNIQGCKPGRVPGEVYRKLLMRINYFRRLAGIHDDIVLDSNWNHYAQAAAFIMYANDELNHDPGPGMKCYSDDGKIGANTSNLSTTVGKGIEILINDEIQDGSTSNNDCGHRRWLLNSEAVKMGIGITDGTYATKVFSADDGNDHDTATYRGKVPEYFAYPFNGYVPYEVVFPKWSFSMPGGADFRSAAVAVTAGDEHVACVIVCRSTAAQYGDPTLVWNINKLREDFDYNYYDMPTKKKAFSDLGLLDKKITVTISNVKVNGKYKSYSYSFTIFDPEK